MTTCPGGAPTRGPCHPGPRKERRGDGGPGQEYHRPQRRSSEEGTPSGRLQEDPRGVRQPPPAPGGDYEGVDAIRL
eukprot:7696888-Pyramimonas_sp.AAC.1